VKAIPPECCNGMVVAYTESNFPSFIHLFLASNLKVLVAHRINVLSDLMASQQPKSCSDLGDLKYHINSDFKKLEKVLPDFRTLRKVKSYLFLDIHFLLALPK
jgi:hypothetical protein